MGKRETRTVRTANRRLAGHDSTGPTAVVDQSNSAMSRPASPPAAKTLCTDVRSVDMLSGNEAPSRPEGPPSGPVGGAGTTFTSSREISYAGSARLLGTSERTYLRFLGAAETGLRGARPRGRCRRSGR